MNISDFSSDLNLKISVNFFCQFQKIPENSKKFQKIQENSRKFLKILENSEEKKFSRNSAEIFYLLQH